MSHFFTVVLVPRDEPDVEGKVRVLLAPYDENLDENEEAKWDFWRIGGRWDGKVRGLEAMDDGKGGFNFDDKFSTVERNVQPVNELPYAFSCYAVVAPDGQWYSRGKMRGFGITENFDDAWPAKRAELLSAYSDHLAVGCDLHT